MLGIIIIRRQVECFVSPTPQPQPQPQLGLPLPPANCIQRYKVCTELPPGHPCESTTHDTALTTTTTTTTACRIGGMTLH